MLPRFLGKKIDRELVSLHPDEIHHAVHVLRVNTNDRVFVFDPEGEEWLVLVLRVNDKQVLGKILKTVNRKTETDVKLTAVVSPPKGKRWDFLLEKLTEIGINTIVPLITSRTVRTIRYRKDRWQRILLSAVKQSGRRLIPRIYPPTEFNEVIEKLREHEKKFIALPDAPHYREVLKGNIGYQTACYLIGPEGGFSDHEIESATSRGFVPINLGPRILRVETAAIVLGILLLEYSERLSV